VKKARWITLIHKLENKMLSITHANYLGNYTLEINFNNQKIGIVNLYDVIFHDKRKIFIELQNEHKFKQFRIEHDTLIWENGLDLAPEFLFFIAFKTEPMWQEKFKQWGYT